MHAKIIIFIFIFSCFAENMALDSFRQVAGLNTQSSTLRPVSTALTKAQQAGQPRKLSFSLEEILPTMPDGFFMADLGGRIVRVNEKLCIMLGYSETDLLGMSIEDIEQKETILDVQRHMKKIQENGYDRFDTVLRRKDGSAIDIEIYATYVHDSHFIVFLRDITERKRALQDVSTFKEAIMASDDSIYMLDLDIRYIFANTEHLERLREDKKIFLEEDKEIIGKKYSDIHSAKEAEYIKMIIQDIQATGHMKREDYEFENFDRVSSRTYSPVRDYETHNIIGVVISSKDTTERKKAEDILRRAAITDGLSGLFNRPYFMEKVENLIGHIFQGNQEEHLSIIMADIDKFKAINDTYGHLNGDLVIRAIADVLKYNVSAEDIVARFGGEEFIIALPRTNREDAVKIAERLRELVEMISVFTADGEKISMTASFGLSTVSSHAEYDSYEMHKKHLLEQLIGRADKALYSAKSKGRNRVETYNDSLPEEQPKHIGGLHRYSHGLRGLVDEIIKDMEQYNNFSLFELGNINTLLVDAILKSKISTAVKSAA
jgi:diguanylate cyclase (GGDEF)-like protein/PAS domain S-box-containing protein